MARAAERRMIGDAEAALSVMPTIFRNRDFREEMGMLPFAASQMLSMLQTLGLIEHAGNIQLWRVVAPRRKPPISSGREASMTTKPENRHVSDYEY